MDTIKKIVLLAALLASAVAGYFVGSQTGKEAKETIAKLEEASKLADAEHKKTVDELKATVSSLNSDFEVKKKQIADAFDSQRGDLLAQLAARQKTIDELKARQLKVQDEIDRLRSHLNDSQSAQERQALLDRIAVLEAEKQATATALRGEECLGVRVPKRVLATLQGEKS